MIKSLTIKKCLNGWDHSVDPNYLESVSKREFFRATLTAASTLLFATSVVANSDKLDSVQWKTLKSVHQHLFPMSDTAPGADEFNATAFLKSVLEWKGVDPSDKQFIEDGAGWLNEIAKKQFNSVFYLLSAEQKEIVLRLVEKSKAGENWLSLILLYLFEALLTDPVYGGNTNKVGWQWLEHQPGFPRPTEDKRYFNI